MDDPLIRVSCPHCGDSASRRASEWDLTDTGTTFACSVCQQVITVALMTREQYVRWAQTEAASEDLGEAARTLFMELRGAVGEGVHREAIKAAMRSVFVAGMKLEHRLLTKTDDGETE